MRPDGAIEIDLVVDDPDLATLVEGAAPADRPVLAARALAVGARALLSSGVAIDVASLDARVQRSVESITANAERRIETLMGAASDAMAEQFDPERRNSLVGRTLTDFTAWREGLLGALDPERDGSQATALLTGLSDLLGPGGPLEARLSAMLDPDADGTALARITTGLEARIAEVRDLIVREQGRASGRSEESARGTAQGAVFEDVIERVLREEAAVLGGCTVERTSDIVGSVSECKKGDLVVTFDDGHRIVIEAKNQARIGLNGKGGILAELDAARLNREALAAICVSARSAFPEEVGPFNVYGDRILVVDDGEGTLLRAAMRWARAAMSAEPSGTCEVDAAAVAERVERIRSLAERLSSMRRNLTVVRDSVDGLRSDLGGLRDDLLDLVDEAARELRKAGLPD